MGERAETPGRTDEEKRLYEIAQRIQSGGSYTREELEALCLYALREGKHLS